MTATTAEAQRLTIMATAGAATLTTLASIISGGGPRWQVGLGAAVVAVVGLAAAEASPELVAKFAALVLITSVFTAGAIVAPRVGALVT